MAEGRISYLPKGRPLATNDAEKTLAPAARRQIASRPENESGQRARESLLFSLIPLIAASSVVRRQGKKLSRQTLRAPFYAQCYLAAFCAAFVAAGDVFLRRPELNNAIGATIICGGVLWFLVVQSAWFSAKLNIPRPKAALIAVWATLRALVYMLLVVIPVGYI